MLDFLFRDKLLMRGFPWPHSCSPGLLPSLSFAVAPLRWHLPQSEALFLYLLDYCLIPPLYQDGKLHICLIDCCVASASSHSARQGGGALWILIGRMNGQRLWKWPYFRSREDALQLSVLQVGICKIGLLKVWCQTDLSSAWKKCIKNKTNIQQKGPIIANKEFENMDSSFKCEVYK